MKYSYLAFALLFLFFACSEDEEDLPKETQENTTTSEDYSLADNLFEGVGDVADQAEKNNEDYLEGGKVGSYLGACVTISFDTVITSSTNKITIDFGTDGCTGRDNRVRKGKVFVDYDGRYRDSGTVITTTFEDYFVDDHQILGERVVINQGTNSDGNKHFDINIDGSIVKPNNGGTIIYKSNRTRTWVEGESTILNWLDDVYEITGTAEGTNSAGLDFTAEITSPFVVKLSCPWVVEGVFELSPDGLNVRTFDFGDGTCDAKANLTVGNFSIDLIMP